MALHLKFALNLDTIADEMIEKVSECWKSPFDAPTLVFPEYKLEQWFRFKWMERRGVLASEPGGRLELPFREGSAAEISFDENGEYGSRGTRVQVTDEMLTSRSFSPDENAYKFYYLDKTSSGVIRYTVGGHSFVMEYDETKLPYVGVWMNNGKFKGFPCVTPEPCSVAFDKVSEARKRGQESVILPGESFSFNLKISIQ